MGKSTQVLDFLGIGRVNPSLVLLGCANPSLGTVRYANQHPLLLQPNGLGHSRPPNPNILVNRTLFYDLRQFGHATTCAIKPI